jgi:release factor glutamine methyltransferase
VDGSIALRKSLIRLWLTLRHQVFGRRHRRLTIEYIDNTALIILPEVFNPVLFRTGECLARAVPAALVRNGNEPLILDLGCGSGVGAVFAARCGARVIAVDLNPEALRCARLNALLNHLDDKIETRPGDLFEPVKDQRFDLILFNPPFYLGQPRDNFDMAWRGEKIFERFAKGLKDQLTPSGCALVVLSTDGESQAALAQLHERGLIVDPAQQRDFGNEVITVYRVCLP